MVEKFLGAKTELFDMYNRQICIGDTVEITYSDTSKPLREGINPFMQTGIVEWGYYYDGDLTDRVLTYILVREEGDFLQDGLYSSTVSLSQEIYRMRFNTDSHKVEVRVK